MSEDITENELSYDEQMEEFYGNRVDWLSDKSADPRSFTDVYAAFLNNDCKGILTYEQAREAYKKFSGQDPENVKECPEIDWVEKQRQECRETWDGFSEKLFKMDAEEYIKLYYPFEPMLRFRF